MGVSRRRVPLSLLRAPWGFRAERGPILERSPRVVAPPGLGLSIGSRQAVPGVGLGVRSPRRRHATLVRAGWRSHHRRRRPVRASSAGGGRWLAVGPGWGADPAVGRLSGRCSSGSSRRGGGRCGPEGPATLRGVPHEGTGFALRLALPPGLRRAGVRARPWPHLSIAAAAWGGSRGPAGAAACHPAVGAETDGLTGAGPFEAGRWWKREPAASSRGRWA
jgi:hypothetical protein